MLIIKVSFAVALHFGEPKNAVRKSQFSSEIQIIFILVFIYWLILEVGGGTGD